MTFILSEDKKSLRQSQKAAVDFLTLKGIEDAGTDVALIMEKVTGYSRSAMFMRGEDELTAEQRTLLEEMITKRGQRIPVQHIVEEAWFYGRSFYVDSRVLIPRFDTEVLIEEVMKVVDSGSQVLDMCTGSGCIIISLVKEAGVKGTGSDISDGALQVAALNAKRLGAECRFIKSDLFEEIHGMYDVIVSNPPYIRTEVIESLETEVKDHDPMLALDGGADGLYFYRKITSLAGSHLYENGKLFFGIGYDQAEEVSDLMRKNGFKDVKVIKDLGGNPRVVYGTRM